MDKKRLIAAAASFARLLDQLEQACQFGFWPALHQVVKILFRKRAPEEVNHVKILPPAITDLEAGQGRFTHIQAIAESYRTPQPGAAAFQIMNRMIYH